jgi:extracellular elastinolytic metalloproteinase
MAPSGDAAARAGWTSAGRRRNTLPALVVVLLIVLQPTASLGVVGGVGDPVPGIDGHGRLPDGDIRRAKLAPASAQVAAADALDAVARWSQFGTPRSLIKHGGYLGGRVSGADAPAAALAWLDRHRGLYRLGGADDFELLTAVSLGGDAHVVVLRQRVDDVPVSPEGLASIGLVGSARDGWRVAYASSSLVGDLRVDGSAELSETDAWVQAAAAAGVDAAGADVEAVEERNGWTVLDIGDLEDTQLVRRVLFPLPEGGVVPAYEATVVEDPEAPTGDRVIVHGRTGALLFRTSLVDTDIDNPRWEVFPVNPPMTPINRHPWNYPSADAREVWCWTPTVACRDALITGSPHPGTPWDVEPVSGASTFTMSGNYAYSAENWFDFLFPGPTQHQPVSSTRDYAFPWNNVWFNEQCNPDVLVVGSGNDIDAATTNLFAGHSRFQDWSYHLGFTEHTWNGQLHNFGQGTAEDDPLIGMVQAGAVSHGPPTYAGRDNAFMRTLPDGTPSQSAMFLWQPIPGAFYAPCVDGDYDMTVIGHEYTHMIENRMIGKGFNRTGFHAGAMGESISDFIAMEYLNEYGFAPGGDRAWAVGPYVTGNGERGIRNYNMSWPSSGHFPEVGRYVRVNPLNFSNVGYDVTGPQVHADGEIWSATNYDIRELFVERYGGGGARVQRECADGQRPVAQCPGGRRWMQIVFDAFLLMPTGPTFLDARDAYLAADLMRFGGANQDLLWLGFGRRGFGEHAATTGTQDTMPVPSWESPLHDEATLVFSAVAKDEGNAPIPDAKVHVGHYEARVTPAATTAPGDNTLRILPDATRQAGYDFVAVAEGHGHVRFRVPNLRAGETRNVQILFPTNVASIHNGAVATGDGERHDDLIDDTEGTNWRAAGAPVQGRQVVVDLGGRQTFDRAKVSAHLLPGQNRFTALRAFELLACTATPAQPCDPAQADRWGRIHSSRTDAFPGDNPRPVAPALILRSFEVPRTTATHVLFRVTDNQCTGQTSFHGKQDRDPRHETDCRIGTPLPPRNTEVHAAELQLHTSRPQVVGAQQAD